MISWTDPLFQFGLLVAFLDGSLALGLSAHLFVYPTLHLYCFYCLILGGILIWLLVTLFSLSLLMLLHRWLHLKLHRMFLLYFLKLYLVLSYPHLMLLLHRLLFQLP